MLLAKEKITKARAGLVLDQPFFASLALRLNVIEDKTCETGWTDGKTLAYNSKFIDGLSLDECKGFIAHEVMHLACAHHARRGNRDHKKFNISCDFAINPILIDSKFKLPPKALIADEFKGMSAEEIYTRIPDPEQQNNKGSSKNKDKNDQAGSQQQQQDNQESNSNSDPGNCGEVRDAKPNDPTQQPSQATMTQAEEEMKVAVAQAAQQARAMGNMPAALDRLIQDIIAPKLDWRIILRRFISEAAKNDFRWFPPNKRYIHQGLYLPSLRSEELPPITIGIDTSGSIDQKQLDEFATEISTILEEHKTSCTIIYWDAKIQHVEEFSSDDLPIKLNPKGGGGTDVRKFFDYVDQQEPPSCVIVFTDMETPFPKQEPLYPVLWITENKTIKEPFGERVEL